MTRTTQYIGLTDRAKQWLEEIGAVPVKDSQNKTFGMFEEDVPLGEWTNPRDSRMSIKEVLQASPWSSGPMLFTCLEIRHFHCHPDGSPYQVYTWFIDPMISYSQEYDPSTGGYNI